LGSECNTLRSKELLIENTERKLQNKGNFADNPEVMKGNKRGLSGIAWLRIMAGCVVMLLR
jgi:hypothetical protein